MGRALLSALLPRGLPFALINQVMNKRSIFALVRLPVYRTVGLKETVIFADRLMYTGFQHATRAGVSIGVDDMVVPEEKPAIIANSRDRGKRDPGSVWFRVGHDR